MTAHLYALLLHWVQGYGLPGTFVFMAAESAGVPFPTQFGFLVAEGLVGAGVTSYWTAFAIIVSGHLLGAGASFYLGRAADNALTRRLACRPSVMHARTQLQGWYSRYGALTVLFGRLEGHVRPWASFVAGMSQVSQGTFWLWTVIGTIIYSAVAMWITKYGWALWNAHPHTRVPIVVVVLLCFYGVPLYKLIEHLIKRRKKGEPQQAAA